jgi:Sugar phosphate permease
MNSGILPALLPFLIFAYDFTYTAAAALIFAANIVSSVSQPFIGIYSDIISKKWMVPLGLILGSSGLAVIGFLDNYWAIFAAIMVSGLGTALFHPEAAKTVTLNAGKNKASDMSIFSLGGTLGFALGPIVATVTLMLWDLQGLIILIIPSLIMSLIIWKVTSEPAGQKAPVSSAATAQELPKDQWKPFSLLSVVLIMRSIVFISLNTFIPLFWITIILQSNESGNILLSIFLISTSAGTLFGGRIADSLGYLKVIRYSFIAVVPVLFILSVTESFALSALMIIAAGFLIFMPYSSLVVLGQQYLPNRVGLASGVTLGLSVSAGGVFAPVLGKIADIYGVSTVMTIIFVIAVIALIFTLMLSRMHKQLKLSASY